MKSEFTEITRLVKALKSSGIKSFKAQGVELEFQVDYPFQSSNKEDFSIDAHDGKKDLFPRDSDGMPAYIQDICKAEKEFLGSSK